MMEIGFYHSKYGYQSVDSTSDQGNVVVDSFLSSTSKNPVENKKVTQSMNAKGNRLSFDPETMRLNLMNGDTVLSYVNLGGQS